VTAPDDLLLTWFGPDLSELDAVEARCDRWFASDASFDEQLRARFESFYGYALAHQEVIERFGRFPHRNLALSRATIEEEHTYLEKGGATF